MAIREGKAAPAFTLPDADGNLVALESLAGKDVIVYFYPEDDTPSCTKEACGFRDGWREFKKKGVVVLGVSPDSGASHQKFAAKYKLPFTLLSDPERKMMKTYDAWGEKVLYGNKVIGVLRSTVWIGPDGKVRKHWKRVTDSAKHPGHVLAALSAGSPAKTRSARA